MALEVLKGNTQFRYGISNPEQLEQWLQENPNAIGVSFVGRSNVGKSSTINSLFGKAAARVSKTPGRTREVNIFTFEIGEKGKSEDDLPPLFFYDLPGYGHAKVSKDMSDNWDQLMGHFFQLASRHTLMVNIQDARHPNQKSDQEFHDYLKGQKFETFVVFNKLDKLKKQSERAALNKLKPLLFKEFKWVRQIHFISAESGQGMDQLLGSIITFVLDRAALQKKIEEEKGN
ncbi:ribosome biogenesis GTP-binding protein YsxC [Bacteriovorax sp. BSW11_IV]|uniref:ribosome biogenesis GTP-binding protein YihA/YsxC n=1 Tax=Bacteriovorax sp. BSW11_IV TaxID=1353529 RepID=UPI00038A3115|nr:ribosome biogenesis GTP-binding protein YihA/YsxC [Bacteriovorax sp. BSW11_IV]EQC49549.1 ribosome biogenesis GTP-binding protein YsxC [Bacteriovorax sp. BSW11_IV]